MTRTGLAGLVLLLAACGGGGVAERDNTPAQAASPASGMTDAAEFVCDDFAEYARDGQPRDQRSATVSKMGRLIGAAETELKDAYDVLARSVDSPDSQWSIAADTFAQACFDAGWDG